MNDKPKITTEDVLLLWPYAIEYLVDILNDEYGVIAARDDLRSLIGSRHDPRAGSIGG
jgi:hypothetical protein